jgi:hypothetical protein
MQPALRAAQTARASQGEPEAQPQLREAPQAAGKADARMPMLKSPDAELLTAEAATLGASDIASQGSGSALSENPGGPGPLLLSPRVDAALDDSYTGNAGLLGWQSTAPEQALTKQKGSYNPASDSAPRYDDPAGVNEAKAEEDTDKKEGPGHEVTEDMPSAITHQDGTAFPVMHAEDVKPGIDCEAVSSKASSNGSQRLSGTPAGLEGVLQAQSLSSESASISGGESSSLTAGSDKQRTSSTTDGSSSPESGDSVNPEEAASGAQGVGEGCRSAPLFRCPEIHPSWSAVMSEGCTHRPVRASRPMAEGAEPQEPANGAGDSHYHVENGRQSLDRGGNAVADKLHGESEMQFEQQLGTGNDNDPQAATDNSWSIQHKTSEMGGAGCDDAPAALVGHGEVSSLPADTNLQHNVMDDYVQVRPLQTRAFPGSFTCHLGVYTAGKAARCHAG